MDLIQLRMFCLVAQTGSVVRAAEQLHRVPSNLTTRLQQLEQELGIDLFIREKHRLRLAPIGHNFLCYAQRILTLSDEAISMTRSGGPKGNFALGAIESIAATRLPRLLAAYHQRYPEVTLTLRTATSGDLINQVRAGTLEAALVNGPVTYNELTGSQAFAEYLVMISDRHHAPIVDARDASGVTLLAFQHHCAYQSQLMDWFKQEGASPGNLIEVQSYHAMLAAVAGGAGLGLIPHSVLIQSSAHEWVKVHKLPARIANASTWLIRRRETFCPNVEAIEKLIIEQFHSKDNLR
ncbi:LysR family transcriptional regulator [Brenneria sp. 4F2]|nr:LysR family transcriptional regulator [Brenneria bubanii]